jgi:hypothetical protein
MQLVELAQDTALRSLPTGGSVFGGLGLDASAHGVVIAAAATGPEYSRTAVGTAAQQTIAIEATSRSRSRRLLRLHLPGETRLSDSLTNGFIVDIPQRVW